MSNLSPISSLDPFQSNYGTLLEEKQTPTDTTIYTIAQKKFAKFQETVDKRRAEYVKAKNHLRFSKQISFAEALGSVVVSPIVALARLIYISYTKTRLNRAEKALAQHKEKVKAAEARLGDTDIKLQQAASELSQHERPDSPRVYRETLEFSTAHLPLSKVSLCHKSSQKHTLIF